MTRAWARLLLGAACAAVGVVLTLKPFTSLEALVLFIAGAFVATGVSELVAARDADPLPARVDAGSVRVAGWGARLLGRPEVTPRRAPRRLSAHETAQRLRITHLTR